jgi:hypothetical protein
VKKRLSVDELPVRLAHRVKDLDHLPDKLHEMPSIQKVKNWYAQSFEVRLSTTELMTGIGRVSENKLFTRSKGTTSKNEWQRKRRRGGVSRHSQSISIE